MSQSHTNQADSKLFLPHFGSVQWMRDGSVGMPGRLLGLHGGYFRMTPHQMAQRCAHLLGGNGLSTNQSIEIMAIELGNWKREIPRPAEEVAKQCALCIVGPRPTHTRQDFHEEACDDYDRRVSEAVLQLLDNR